MWYAWSRIVVDFPMVFKGPDPDDAKVARRMAEEVYGKRGELYRLTLVPESHSLQERFGPEVTGDQIQVQVEKHPLDYDTVRFP
jgi:hypothetical protein